MTGKVTVAIEQDKHGCYAWCPELKGCQSQGETVEEALANIRDAIELFVETLTDEERSNGTQSGDSDNVRRSSCLTACGRSPKTPLTDVRGSVDSVRCRTATVRERL